MLSSKIGALLCSAQVDHSTVTEGCDCYVQSNSVLTAFFLEELEKKGSGENNILSIEYQYNTLETPETVALENRESLTHSKRKTTLEMKRPSSTWPTGFFN